jgi:uncharacterized protein YraI
MTLHTVRIDAVELRGWARWRVLDDDGRTVGVVAEHRPVTDDGLGPVEYHAAHNPTLELGRACWRSDGHATVPSAVAALAEHLADAHADEQERS